MALETEFEELRYFKRITKNDLPVSVVANLKDVFGDKKDDTSRFVKRYLKSTHCDLFFSDAVIMVEGAGERILLPHFIKKCASKLDQSYISLLEINGRHAHRLKSLIEKLGITCLVITDLDIVSNSGKYPSVEYNKDENQITTNNSITDWVVHINDVNTLLELSFDKKSTSINDKNAFVRIAYQTPVKVDFSDNIEHTFVPYTFEDSLAYENFEYFKKSRALGGIKKIRNIFKEKDLSVVSSKIYRLLRDTNRFSKAEFALDLLFSKDPKDLNVPHYIEEALVDLEKHLSSNTSPDFLSSEDT